MTHTNQQTEQRRRVVVTGLGTINALGHDVAVTWDKIAAGQSGIQRISGFDASEFKTQIGGEVRDFDPVSIFGRKEARRLDRATQYALVAAEEAVKMAGIDQLSASERAKIGVVLGTGLGGISTTEEAAETMFRRGVNRVSPFFIPMMLADSIPARISMTYGLQGPNMALATACASAANAIGEAMEMIRHGRVDIIISGGAETGVLPLSLAGFNAMGAMSTRNDEPERASRPFDAGRDGFVPADGAAILVLEALETAQARGATIWGELVGYGTSADAYHVSAPREDGAGAVVSMQMALRDAGLMPEQIDYVNMHGTSTTLNDQMETVALKKIFGEYAYALPASSTKSMHGHLLGATGALELLVCLLAMKHDWLPPTINYEQADPLCDLDYVPNEGRTAVVNTFISNSFGFGGHNATLIGKKF